MGDLLGGSSSSTVTQTSDTNVVTQSDLDAFNEQVNKNVINSIMKDAQRAGGSQQLIDTTTVGPLVASGHATINANMSDTQKARITFQAIENSAQSAKIRNTLANQFAEQLANKTNTNVFNNLVSKAEAKMKSGLLSSLLDPGSSASSDVNTNITTNINTSQSTTLKNIIKSLVATSNTVKSIKSCFFNTFIEQNSNFAGVDASDYATVNINDTVNQIANSVVTCNQRSNQANNVAAALAQLMGIKVVQSSKTTATTKSTAIAKSSNVKKGLGDLLSGPLGMIICGVIILCCLVLFGFSVYELMGKKKTGMPTSSALTGLAKSQASPSSQASFISSTQAPEDKPPLYSQY